LTPSILPFTKQRQQPNQTNERNKKNPDFFGDLKNPEKVLTYTCGNDLAEHVLSLYRLREKYS
jgi:hypothetical protein